MITQFKIFEKLNEVKIGDYVVMNPLTGNNSSATKVLEILNNFLTNNIGQIVDVLPDYFRVKYKKSPIELSGLGYFSPDHIRCFLRENRIMFKSKNKEDCEAFIAANKYNL